MSYGLIPVTINVDTRRFVKSNNLSLPFQDRPRLFPPEISILAMSCVDNNGDAIDTFTAGDTWELFIDKDFDHDIYEGTLDSGYTGAITSVDVTFDSDPGTLASTGGILLRNSDGERERVEYTAVSGTGVSRTFTVSVTLSYTYVSGDFCATEDPLMVISDNDDANISGDWADLSVVGGKVSMRMNSTSYTFIRKVNEYLAANANEEEMRVFMEIRRYPAGDSTPTVILQDTVYARPTVADTEGGAVISGGSWSAADARYVRSPANLTTQYRGVFVDSAGFITESSTITTNSTGDLLTNTALFNTSYTVTGSEPVGASYWDADNKTMSTVLEGGVIGQWFEEDFIPAQNDTGVTIDDGMVATYESSIGNSGNIRIELTTASASEHPMMTIGLVTADIANGAQGKVTVRGKVRGIQTDGANYSETWSDGDILYKSSTVAGGLTNVAPNAPTPAIPIAVVISAHATNGTLLVRPSIPCSMTGLSDVNGTALTADGQIPVWDNTAGYFDFTANINSYVLGQSNLTTQYRGVFVNAAGEVTESSSITTNASGHLIAGTALFGGASLVGSEKLGVNGEIYVNSAGPVLRTGSLGVGIGLEAPVELGIYSGGNVSRMQLFSSTSGTAGGEGVQYAISGLDGYNWNFENGNFIFGTNNTEAMRIDSSQNVLIGTTSQYASETLGVNGDVYVNGAGHIQGTAAGADLELLRLKNSSATDGTSASLAFTAFASDTTTGKLSNGFISGAGGGYFMAISDFYDGSLQESARFYRGNLLIGTTSQYASEKLGVAGDGYFNGDLTVVGDLTANRGIAHGYISTAAATSTITSGTPRNLVENATISEQDVSSNDFTVDNTAKNVKYTGTATKNFVVDANISMISSVSNQTVSMYIAKNGTVITGSKKDRKIGTGADVGNMSVDWAVSLATNDTIAVYVDLSTNGTITANQGTINIIEA